MRIFLLILVFAIITIWEIPKLIEKKWWAELVTVAALLLIGFSLSLLQAIGVQVPNPQKGIENMIKLVW